MYIPLEYYHYLQPLEKIFPADQERIQQMPHCQKSRPLLQLRMFNNEWFSKNHNLRLCCMYSTRKTTLEHKQINILCFKCNVYLGLNQWLDKQSWTNCWDVKNNSIPSKIRYEGNMYFHDLPPLTLQPQTPPSPPQLPQQFTDVE